MSFSIKRQRHVSCFESCPAGSSSTHWSSTEKVAAAAASLTKHLGGFSLKKHLKLLTQRGHPFVKEVDSVARHKPPDGEAVESIFPGLSCLSCACSFCCHCPACELFQTKSQSLKKRDFISSPSTVMLSKHHKGTDCGNIT